jgi:macrolide phosphotransferase
MRPKIEREARILDFVKHQIPAQVPDWQVCSAELIAYPRLTDDTALTFDAQTHAVTWNMAQHARAYITSLAPLLAALHRAPVSGAFAAGIPCSTPQQARAQVLDDLERVKSELGMRADLEGQWRRWIDDDRLWPDFSVLVHGDLYAGHVTVDASARISGVIDWSEAEVSDPSIDFTGHLAVFGPESLEALVSEYARAGGRTWATMVEQIEHRHSASPIKYGLFALVSRNEEHLAAARAQLGVS